VPQSGRRRGTTPTPTEGGPCNHAFYAAQGRGHPGIVKVTVSNGYWTCEATYQGTQGDNGSLSGAGDPPQACTKT
jgi:hypothetical protein